MHYVCSYRFNRRRKTVLLRSMTSRALERARSACRVENTNELHSIFRKLYLPQIGTNVDINCFPLSCSTNVGSSAAVCRGNYSGGRSGPVLVHSSAPRNRVKQTHGDAVSPWLWTVLTSTTLVLPVSLHPNQLRPTWSVSKACQNRSKCVSRRGYVAVTRVWLQKYKHWTTLTAIAHDFWRILIISNVR